MPKIDLHRHLEGTIRPETIYELSRRTAHNKPKYNLFELKLKMKVDGKEKRLIDFISKLGTKYMLEHTRSKDDIKRFTYEACDDASKDNILYLELRFCPSNYYRTPLTLEEFFDGVFEGAQEAQRDLQIETNLIVAIKREDPLDLNLQIAQTIIDYFQKGKIVGVDLCGNEPIYPARRYKDLFDIFHSHNIPISVHAGESKKKYDAKNIIESIQLLHAQRIGHGTVAIKSEEALDIIRKNNILLELCPTSNIHTKVIDSVENHPVYKLKQKNVKFTVGTDDPVTSALTLSKEYSKLLKYHNFTIVDFKQFNIDAIHHAFISKNNTGVLITKYKTAFEKWSEHLQDQDIYEFIYSVSSHDRDQIPFPGMS